LDKRDDDAFKFYIDQLGIVSEFLKNSEDEKIGHGEIDPTRRRNIYQPPYGYISRRAS